MSHGVSLPLKNARKLAGAVAAALAPGCERIEIAGSIRREKLFVGDIELVAIPRLEYFPGQLDLFGQAKPGKTVNHLDQALAGKLAALDRPIFKSKRDLLIAMHKPIPLHLDDLTRWGERWKRFYLWGNDEVGIVPVDLFITTPEAWGAIFCIRTGPGDFSKALVTRFRRHTLYYQADGSLKRKDTSAVVPVPEERDYFRLAGVVWVEPALRSLQTLRAMPHPATRTDVRYNGPPITVTDWLRSRLLEQAGVSTSYAGAA